MVKKYLNKHTYVSLRKIVFVIAIRNLEAIRKRKKYTGDKFRNAAAAAYNVIKQLKLFLFDDKNKNIF